MTDEDGSADRAWSDALLAAAITAIDGARFGGVVLRAPHGPVRQSWLDILTTLMPAGVPVRKMPSHIGDDRLIGGLDLAASLSAGRRVADHGLLAASHGGLVVVPMAERLASTTAARLAAAFDTGTVTVARDGLDLCLPARFAMVALDEGATDEDAVPSGLRDRLALHLDLTGVDHRQAVADLDRLSGAVSEARSLRTEVTVPDQALEALCATAAALGIDSLRPSRFAVAVARTLAMLDGRSEVCEADVVDAARLVLAPRATCLPADPDEIDEPQDGEKPPSPEDQDTAEAGPDDDKINPESLEDIVIAATAASIPDKLLERWRTPAAGRGGDRAGGRTGAVAASRRRGRPVGATAGSPGDGARLNLIETLRAAAPWQRLRATPDDAAGRIHVRKSDFRIARHKRPTETTTIFVVDASGSSALHRLSEAKGAVELLLAECYARRDHVALITFRGTGAELLLPATRSLFRAKRNLAGMRGGGGTPLASALQVSVALADQERRRDRTPMVVLLTDGRANITLDGRHDRGVATADATAQAAGLRATGVPALLIDTGPRPDPRARTLADAMTARYVPMPQAGAQAMSAIVRGAVETERHAPHRAAGEQRVPC
ncbi:magnesium chelatase subunit D [Amorphus orientalis]|uniref:Magnesium chelatase subunit D n=1 Tax=Amorphus orientalis TaxID=649198 RepID=A0AAE4ASV0_9HYPH|nr:magnesium chelatase subunit D [Amorphus orientalis]MDQ0315492.1 magnesium chelatase subunit D [Amorphus orientalis]